MMLKKSRLKPDRKFIFSTCVNLERVGFDVGNFLCSSEVKNLSLGRAERLSGQFEVENFASSTYEMYMNIRLNRILFLNYNKHKKFHTQIFHLFLH